MKESAKNIVGEKLIACGMDPVTGFYRNGCCDTGPQDAGSHTVCVAVTDEFLSFTKSAGNDLSTPAPQYGFPGLKAGDRWCLCNLLMRLRCVLSLWMRSQRWLLI